MSYPREDRRGTSTVEALVCLLLTALLAQMSWSLLLAARRTTSRLIDRSEALETERVGWHVLSHELRAGLGERDWSVASARVLPLRAYRGLAELCGAHAVSDGGVVRYQGMRLPEPAKDSLLLLTSAGEWRAVKLLSRVPTTTSCPAWPGAELERWSWEPRVDDVLLARVFERGSYHLEDRALRYRLGDGGRQPLTVERLEAGSAFASSPSGIELRLQVRVQEGVVWESTRRLGGGDPDGG